MPCSTSLLVAMGLNWTMNKFYTLSHLSRLGNATSSGCKRDQAASNTEASEPWRALTFGMSPNRAHARC